MRLLYFLNMNNLVEHKFSLVDANIQNISLQNKPGEKKLLTFFTNIPFLKPARFQNLTVKYGQPARYDKIFGV